MTIRKIIKYPQPSLRANCASILFDSSGEFKSSGYLDLAGFVSHIQDLHDTLNSTANGVALASNQILPEAWRIFVVRKSENLPAVLINPTWAPVNDEMTSDNEGCLSEPELVARVPRFSSVHVRWQNKDGSVQDKIVSGLDAQIVQHECDHLNGKLLIDYLSKSEQIKARAEAIRNRKAGK